jgi:hypothetical protein
MSEMTFLYQALAKARATVAELERAIEHKAFNSPTGYTGNIGYNADSNGNRETFYHQADKENLNDR